MMIDGLVYGYSIEGRSVRWGVCLGGMLLLLMSELD